MKVVMEKKLKVDRIDNKRPLITIITAVYNGIDFIEETILSVINQDCKEFEYIIVDGGSKDGTVDIIKKYEDKISLWKSEPDKGFYDAVNKGIELSQGEYIGLINCGDFLVKNILSEIYLQLANNKYIDILYADMFIFYSENIIRIKKSNIKSLKTKMDMNHPTCYVKREIYNKRKYSLKYPIAADYDFLLWCYLNNFKFHYLNKEILYFRAGGISDNPTVKYLDAFYIWKKNFGFFYALFFYSRDSSIRLMKLPLKRIIGLFHNKESR
jgi:glycosyltransferase involved in cell wall biosynthesis